MDYANYHDQVGYRANAITTAFKLAINGSFHSARSAGKTPTPSQKTYGESNVQYALYAFENTLISMVDEIVTRSQLSPAASMTSSDIEEMRLALVAQIRNIGHSMSEQGIKAINSGHGHKAASLLSLTNTAHGAMGELVRSKLSRGVELVAKDTFGRQWKNPEALVKTIVRDFAYKIYVKTQVSEAVLAGNDSVTVFSDGKEIVVAIADLDSLKGELFHVNSNVVFGED